MNLGWMSQGAHARWTWIIDFYFSTSKIPYSCVVPLRAVPATNSKTPGTGMQSMIAGWWPSTWHWTCASKKGKKCYYSMAACMQDNPHAWSHIYIYSLSPPAQIQALRNICFQHLVVAYLVEHVGVDVPSGLQEKTLCHGVMVCTWQITTMKTIYRNHLSEKPRQHRYWICRKQTPVSERLGSKFKLMWIASFSAWCEW